MLYQCERRYAGLGKGRRIYSAFTATIEQQPNLAMGGAG